MKPEIHLFIIWEKARKVQDKILNDLATQFTILKQYEITWTPLLVASNYTRFCGTRLGDQLKLKIDSCGTGEFLLCIVRDENPRYQERKTLHGTDSVNSKTFDAKWKYRNWCGFEIGVHATDNEIETNHDLTLLIGKNVEDFLATCKNSEVEKLHRDLEGANGWESLKQLFYVLNNTTRYAIMRGYGELATGDFIDHGDTDIMTDDYDNMWIIVNAPKVDAEYTKPKAKVCIGNDSYLLDIWDCGWQGMNYFDPVWSQDMLQTAIIWNGAKILNPQNDFYCLLYHCLTNKGNIAEDYLRKLKKYKKEFGIEEADWNKILVTFLKKNHYEVIRPKDKDNPFRTDNPIISAYALRHGVCVDISKLPLGYVYTFEKANTIVRKGAEVYISNEYNALSILRDGEIVPRLITPQIQDEGEEKWIEFSKIDGVRWKAYLRKKNYTVSNIRQLIKGILVILNSMHTKGIIHNAWSIDNIYINEQTKRVSVDTFIHASIRQPDEVDGNYKQVEELLSTNFRSIPYFAKCVKLFITEVPEEVEDACQAYLKKPMDIISLYCFYRKKYKWLKEYIRHPKKMLTKLFHKRNILGRIKRKIKKLLRW